MLKLRIFVASPGDVSDERSIALRVLDELPYRPLLKGKVHIETVAWDKPGSGTPMLATLTPQEAIANGHPRPSECDIVVVILWSRMGTPLPEDVSPEFRKADGSRYLSGTEWEYEDAERAAREGGRPAIIVYRRQETPSPAFDDPDYDERRLQWDRVKAFFDRFRNADGSIRGGVETYAAPADFQKLLETHLETLIAKRLGSGRTARPTASDEPAAAPPPRWDKPPFPGLRAFTRDEEPIFFGRGREVDRLIERMRAERGRFLLIDGPSGAGKSSLVAAGLLPRLRANAIAGSKDWCAVRFTPGEIGDDPVLALAVRLLDEYPTLDGPGRRAREMADELAADPSSVARLAERSLDGAEAWSEIVLFVDQLEELFTLGAPRHQAAFIAVIAAAARGPRTRVVCTMRSDFHPRCVEHAGLAEMLQGSGSFPLALPNMSGRIEMIKGPARLVGVEFERSDEMGDLVDRILQDVGHGPGALALTAFALQQLYEQRTPKGVMTHAAYDAFGGVAGAIASHADAEVARARDENGRPIEFDDALRNAVFSKLVGVDERGIPTRKRADLDGYAPGSPARAIVDRLVDARLLVTSGTATGTPQGPMVAPTLEVAHEALLTAWPALERWIDLRRDDLFLRQQVRMAAAEWDRLRRDDPDRADAHLWPHERLNPVTDMLERLSPDDLTDAEREFMTPESERLLAELLIDDTTHYRRAEIGDRLARIGDPRPGVGLRRDGLPDIVWCEVDDGEFRMGADHQSDNPTRTESTDRFLIAKYPVTFAQYRAFLSADDGYANRQWWREPVELADRDGDPGEQHRPIDNHPAEMVSWYDAVAFCRWLTHRMRVDLPEGEVIRLPTEQEWEKVARGTEGMEYPWGDGWLPHAANIAESKLGRTTAVGMYPAGAATAGCRGEGAPAAQDVWRRPTPLDLSGNVWECCLNWYANPERIGDNGDVARVVRGGSWLNARARARAAFRNWSDLDSRLANYGFRLVRGSPISQER